MSKVNSKLHRVCIKTKNINNVIQFPKRHPVVKPTYQVQSMVCQRFSMLFDWQF